MAIDPTTGRWVYDYQEDPYAKNIMEQLERGFGTEKEQLISDMFRMGIQGSGQVGVGLSNLDLTQGLVRGAQVGGFAREAGQRNLAELQTLLPGMYSGALGHENLSAALKSAGELEGGGSIFDTLKTAAELDLEKYNVGQGQLATAAGFATPEEWYTHEKEKGWKHAGFETEQEQIDYEKKTNKLNDLMTQVTTMKEAGKDTTRLWGEIMNLQDDLYGTGPAPDAELQKLIDRYNEWKKTQK